MGYAQILENLRRTFEMASARQIAEGCDWYRIAKSLCSNDDDCKALAILSAQTEWNRNVELLQMLKRGDSRPADVPQARWENAAKGIMRQDGKVYNFYLSIRSGGEVGICVDTHILKCAFNNNVTTADQRRLFRSKSKLYQQIADAICEIAEEENLFPAQVQAIIWVVWRATNGRKRLRSV
jgi:hypothetical protein